jgi:hypothetical protein
MRERLMALINDVVHPCHAGALADYLIENGVIVPPCKVGDTVYYRSYGGNRLYEGEVTSFIYNTETGRFGIHYDGGYGTYGKHVFLTREEAEQAMKGENHAEIH